MNSLEFNNLKYRETMNEKRKEKRAIRRLMLREKKRARPAASIQENRPGGELEERCLEIGGENVSG